MLGEIWGYFVEDLPSSVVNPFTIFGYLLTSLLLFLPGWILTHKVTNTQVRMLFSAGLVALAWAPALTTEPGGMVLLVPALLGVVWGAMLYLLPGDALGFYFYHALVSLLLTGSGGAIFAVIIYQGIKNKWRRKGSCPGTLR